MGRTRAQITSWERQWAPLVATCAFIGSAMLIASGLVSGVSGENAAETLLSVHENSGSVVISGVMQGLGFLLLIVPLYYLFRVVQARSSRVRPQLVGLVVIAPLFLAVSSGISGAVRTDAANQFAAHEAKSTLSSSEASEKCTSDRKDEGAKEFAEEHEARQGETPLAACEREKTEDNEAENATGEASLASVATGLGIAGGLGLVVAIVYSCLWAMRTGVLSRFWASLGMALAVASLLGLIFFTLIWFVYFGLLAIGKVPGGRPPAWEAGEAVPWPTPGEKAAAELEPEEGDVVTSEEDEDGGDEGPGSERRKRKQRD
jgi:hypothetical protein